jgi:hypothetical protein
MAELSNKTCLMLFSLTDQLLVLVFQDVVIKILQVNSWKMTSDTSVTVIYHTSTAASPFKVRLNNISSIWCQVAEIQCVYHLGKVRPVQQNCQDVKIVIWNKLFHCYCCHLVRIMSDIAEMTLTSFQVMSEVTLKQPIIIKLTKCLVSLS